MTTISKLSQFELSQLMTKLDNISDYLNILMLEINEIKKTIKMNTYQATKPLLFPIHENKVIPFYQDTNSHYGINPDIIFK
jgi:hypothetical protein